MKAIDIEQLIKEYGKDATLEEILKKMKGDYIYKCPKCGGKGYTLEGYNAYPPGLPDSGWVTDWQYKKVTCDLCGGRGYTKEEYQRKTKIVFDGYEKK